MTTTTLLLLLASSSTLITASGVVQEGFAKDAGNLPYVQSGPDGVFYARCIPAAPTGTSGFTEIYRVRPVRDERVDHYEWFTKYGVVLGWSPIAGKVAVMAIRPQPSDSLDKQLELSFYLGGKHIKSWSTEQLKSLGADEVINKPGGRMAMFQVVGNEQIPGSNEYVFTIQIANNKKLRFDILTGDLYAEDSNKEPSHLVEATSQEKNPAQSPQHPSYEIVLEGEQVAFDKAQSVSIPITVRNLGMKKLFMPDVYWGLSVVWDGKAYKRNPRYTTSWNGMAELLPFPRGLWHSGFSLSEYLVPMDLLTAGPHTIALRDAFAESNTQTIFVEKGSAEHERTGSAASLTNAQIQQPPASVTDGAAWGDPVEGVFVRLRAEKSKWATNETPTFNVDVSNQGHREFYTFRSQEPGRLEVDGVWYEWTGVIDLKASPISPGRKYQDIKVTLGLDWEATQEWRDKTQPRPPQLPVKLLPGKHTIRFAPEIREIGVEPKPRNTYVPSNPIVIETS